MLLANCKIAPKKENTIGLTTQKAMVVSARIEASSIGTAILKKGGNAFDAMMATELALAVAYPYAGNIGGGGFMVYRKSNGEIGALDYREKAPLAATRDMYLDNDGNIIKGKSTVGASAVGVPGTIAGVFNNQEQAFLDVYCGRIPIGRMANVDEYNGSILFLASSASRYMTGSNLIIDGGWSAI